MNNISGNMLLWNSLVERLKVHVAALQRYGSCFLAIIIGATPS